MALVDTSLVSGPLPTVVTFAGAVGLAVLVLSRRRGHLLRSVPICLIAAVVLTVVGWVVVEKIWRGFPDPIQTSVYVWIGVGLLGLLLVVPRVVAARRWWTTVLALLATVAVVATAALQVNLVFAAYPTVGSALGLDAAEKVGLDEATNRTADPITGSSLESVWTPPADLPSGGRILDTPIPGTVSGFAARNAQVYLPPAYFAPRRPLLPVLVLMAGQPGAPDDWLTGGRLVQTMDAYAADHGGLAPVVVVADATGSAVANPLCVDSPLGNVATYLSTDVPAWVRGTLQIDPDPSAWAVGGLSYGGTCALQMATNFPQVYPTFLVLSGQLEPTLGDRRRTLDAAFGGSEAAFEAVNPMNLLATKRYDGSAGVFVVGADDPEYKGYAAQLVAAARAAGMDVQYLEVPGGHSYQTWSEGLRREIGWLGTRTGITS
ncbi:alpha/beta hydrolase [Rhodococcoides corynebacterioides]|uniref:Esterase n=1 Tax=Rhodococcoides corynebacterioides TaxID=53972 RepID=A0ABS7P0X4_9NOCA|nr:alpha/beta hydrolase-fold protein [Rhodococcus corynebacterioides]MBY6366038.1 esterase [Rhodococcus corynebacterioides]MBY6408869.1 esterase [Rhodococcus corynebacterioides]